jgi:hypothetical protein
MWIDISRVSFLVCPAEFNAFGVFETVVLAPVGVPKQPVKGTIIFSIPTENYLLGW